MDTVTFCGNSNLSETELPLIKERVKNLIESLIKSGIHKFLLGGYGAFDILCANILKDFKKSFNNIRLILILAYINTDYDRALYDYAKYPPLGRISPKYAIPKRNQYMIDGADIVVAYVKNSFGGAAATLKYAEKEKKCIIRLTDI